MWIIYVIQNDKTFEKYIGMTQNLSKRLETHNAKGVKFTTRKKGKWVLIYAEAYRSKSDAQLREKRLKIHGSGKLELLKRLQNSLFDIKIGEGRS